MSKRTAAPAEPEAPTIEIDRTSAEVVLYFVGQRSARNAPARDLTHNDIARLAYREALDEVLVDVGRPIDPDDPDAGVIERPDHKTVDQERANAIVAGLLESGSFALEAPAVPAEEPEPTTPPTDAPDTTTPADVPATQPEA